MVDLLGVLLLLGPCCVVSGRGCTVCTSAMTCHETGSHAWGAHNAMVDGLGVTVKGVGRIEWDAVGQQQRLEVSQSGLEIEDIAPRDLLLGDRVDTNAANPNLETCATSWKLCKASISEGNSNHRCGDQGLGWTHPLVTSILPLPTAVTSTNIAKGRVGSGRAHRRSSMARLGQGLWPVLRRGGSIVIGWMRPLETARLEVGGGVHRTMDGTSSLSAIHGD